MKEHLEEEVYSKAGYSVVVKRKFHFSFMEWVVKSSTHTKEKLVSREKELYKAGNCIPCAISNVNSAKRLKIIVAVAEHPPAQNSRDGNAVRMYEDWCPPNKTRGFRSCAVEDYSSVRWSLHSALWWEGEPSRCILTHIRWQINCVVKDGLDTYELTHALFEACLVKSYDKKTVVFFGVDVDHSAENIPDENRCLLKLLAGV